MSRVMQMLQAIVRHELARRPHCELALVTAQNDSGDDAQTVDIALKDSGLAIPRVPVATTLTGTAALPRVGDVVLTLFPRGDLGSAVVVGQVYSEQRRPPEGTRDSATLVWPGDTDSADTDAIEVVVKAGSSGRELRLTLGGDQNAQLRLADGELQLQSGGVSLSLRHSSGSDGAIELSAGGTRLQLKQDGDVVVETPGKLTLKGGSVSIEGDTSVKVNGQTVEIN